VATSMDGISKRISTISCPLPFWRDSLVSLMRHHGIKRALDLAGAPKSSFALLGR
jgi:hypothetical protein